MKLKRLYIKDNGILKDFSLELPLDTNNNITVFIGENGSGKTTVLESITKIFSWFISDNKPMFEFELEYIVRIEDNSLDTSTLGESKIDYILVKLFSSDGIVDIECEIGDSIIKGIKAIRANRLLTETKQTIKDNKFKLLPDSVAIYYAGESTNIKKIVEKHNDEYSEAIRDLYDEDKDNFPRLFFYYEPFHFNLIFLALLSFEYGNVPKILEKKIGYQTIVSFTIRLKKPLWGKNEINIKEGNFWGSRGAIAVFLQQLSELASSTIELNNEIEFHFDEQEIINFFQLKNLYGTEKDLFNILEMTWLNDLIKSVDIRVKKFDDLNSPSINSNSLSEGEKQALILLGINELVLKENSLALFDEPDTYLHPQWQREFIPELEKSITNSGNIKNEYIITSHSPNIVSGVKKENLFIFQNGQIKEIPFSSYGKNVESLLIDFFNVEGVRNKYVEKLISEVQTLAKDKDFESENFQRKFNKLKSILGLTAPEIVSINIEIVKNRNK